jgi:hypothetical protein
MDRVETAFRLRSLALIAGAQEARAMIQHQTIYGDHNEGLLADTLRRHLGSRWSVGSGEVLDMDGGLSGQCDIIVYDSSMLPHAFQTMAGNVTVLAHAVGAVIEVKSTISNTPFRRSGEGDAQLLYRQAKAIKGFLDVALTKGFKALRERGDAEHLDLQNKLLHTGITPALRLPPVFGFAYRSDAHAKSVVEAYNKCGIDQWTAPVFVLDAPRDAQTVKTLMKEASKSGIDACTSLVEELRMPNGYLLRDDGHGHFEAHELKADALRYLIRNIVGFLHKIAPTSAMLTTQN